MLKKGYYHLVAVNFIIVITIFFSFYLLPDFARSISPADICPKHNVSTGEFTACYYCHNAETQDEPGFIINTDSRFCLSCHDGSTKEMSIHTNLGSLADRISRPAAIGQKGGVDHPYSVSYSEARNISSTLKLKSIPTAPVKLFNDKVECASCHDSHSCNNPLFLRIKTDRSALCLACHEM